MSYFVVFLIVSSLILLHELGHWVAACVARIPVARVSVGVGRRLFSFVIGTTEYRVSRIPVGGYVLPVADRYLETSPLRRVVFALGGPLANLAFAYVLLVGLNLAAPDAAVTTAFRTSFAQLSYACELVVRALPALVTGGDAPVGPLGVFEQGGELVEGGTVTAVQFAVILSVNLAVLNLVPIPPLDGGRILLCVGEMLSARARRLQIPFNVAGFAVILSLLVWATAFDIRRILARLIA